MIADCEGNEKYIIQDIGSENAWGSKMRKEFVFGKSQWLFKNLGIAGRVVMDGINLGIKTADVGRK